MRFRHSKYELLIFSSEFPPGPGGIGELAFQTALEFSARGYRVIVVSSQDYASPEEIKLFNQVQPFEIFSFRSRTRSKMYGIRKTLTFSLVCLKLKPVVLLTSGSATTLMSYPLTLLFRPKKITTIHGPEYRMLLGHRNGIIRKILAPSVLVAVSRYSAEFIRQTGVAGPIHVLNNAAKIPVEDSPEFTESLKQKYGGNVILMTVGRMYHRKGQEKVIRALPEIVEAHPEVLYFLIGHEELRTHLEQVARECCVSRNVVFVGQIKSGELASYLKLCDIYILLSQKLNDGDFEGFGISIIEAAMMGKPAIGSEDCGIADAVESGKTGYLVPSNDQGAFLKCLRELIKDKQRRTQMGEAARERASSGFTWKSYVDRMIRLVNDHLNMEWKPSLDATGKDL